MSENFMGIEDIFARSIDVIKSGKGDIDSCLAQFPDYAEELRPLLELVLWLDKRRAWFDPRPDFWSASRQRLVARIKKSVRETLEQ
jgi:hypothetical protein